ncbi:unnamed protein product [Peronospora belbahrii]|uniref:Uncharacterized protein n=1 Tax=Peronospora belbahrii TaxID=622444 RepID=A0AAU9KV41_9STRA|nr:unnamed protein product [Peronospora belbahrii]
MATGLPRSASLSCDTPSGSDLKTKSKLHMAPSSMVSAASSPLKPGMDVSLEKKQGEYEAEVKASMQKKPSINKTRRDRSSKPKKKDTASCVGYYIDALDKKMLWGEAKIVDCNLTTQKIKVHFVGWNSNHDVWTDAMSISAHGRYAHCTKDSNVKSWNGDMHLFDDMLGPMDEAMFATAPAPLENKKRVAVLPLSAAKKAKMIKKSACTTRDCKSERSVLKRKSDVGSGKKDQVKHVAATPKVVKSNGHKPKVSKHTAQGVKAKRSAEEKRKLPRDTKKQKRKRHQSNAATTSKTRPSAKNGVILPNDLPLFRNLEMDDGTVMDFSVHREKARKEREAMGSFLDKCALIWKNQQKSLSVG